jgi:signal transduction histidine kinase
MFISKKSHQNIKLLGNLKFRFLVQSERKIVMRLPDFIRVHKAPIIGEWENFARTLVPPSGDSSPLALRNHIEQILTFIADDIETSQSSQEQVYKSRGEGSDDTGVQGVNGRALSVAKTHASLRLAGGFNMDQMVSEWRALRASVIKLWSAENTEMTSRDILDLTRFNEAIDQALTESISYYAKKVEHSKDLFLGILGHDIRNPLGAIQGSAQLTLKIGSLSDRQTMLINQIVESSGRINEIVTHLLDLTRARFGTGLPIIAASMDFAFVARQMISEMRALHPKREITLEISGNTEGEWDKARIAQVFSNLIGNAMQYSFPDTPVNVTVKGEEHDVVLAVLNQGVPIPHDKAGKIFDSLTRGIADRGEEPRGSTNLGLGLYITKEIVTAHGGHIVVESSENGRTTFTACFPRDAVGCQPEENEDMLPQSDNARNSDSENRIH